MRKHFVLLLALVLCIGLLSGCGAKETTAPHSIADLTIRIPVAFLDLSHAAFSAEYDFMFGFDPITVSGLREEKSMFDAYDLDLNAERYGRLVAEINGLKQELTQKDGIWTLTYEENGYTYVVTFHETKKAFWTVQAYCPTDNYAKVSNQMWEILQSITV